MSDWTQNEIERIFMKNGQVQNGEGEEMQMAPVVGGKND